ncbi:MAG: endonuclease/exonuclease/phosphatase family protein [Polyangiaceae bacterium]
MIRIASFNVKDWFEPRSPDDQPVVDRKLDMISATFAELDADVIALQEVGSERLLGEAARRAGYAHSVVGIADKRGIRCAILSRHALAHAEVHRSSELALPTLVEGDAAPYLGRIPMRRGIVHARVCPPRGPAVDVLTVHFKSKLLVPLRGEDGESRPMSTALEHAEGAVRSMVVRAAEALFLRSVVDRLLTEDIERRLVVLGDLNDTRDSLPVSVVRGREPPYALHDCLDAVPAERRFSVRHHLGAGLIDHILASSSLARSQRGARILNEALAEVGPYVPNEPLSPDSDHAAVIAEFEQG